MKKTSFFEIDERYFSVTKNNLSHEDNECLRALNEFIQMGNAKAFNSLSAPSKADLLTFVDDHSLNILLDSFSRGGVVNALKFLDDKIIKRLISKNISGRNRDLLADIYNNNINKKVGVNKSGYNFKSFVDEAAIGRDGFIYDLLRKNRSKSNNDDNLYQAFEAYKKNQEESNDKNSKVIEELLEKISTLEVANSKNIQKRIDENLTKYVESSEKTLNEIQVGLRKSAAIWSFVAGVIVVLTVALGVSYSLFGYKFGPPLSDLKWPELLIVSIKGMVVISSLGIAGIYAFIKSNSYMHEAIIVSNRAHAIQFGKLYLQIYGNTVERSDMVKIFENWNISSETAFSKNNNGKSNITNLSELLDSLKKVKELIPSIGKE